MSCTIFIFNTWIKFGRLITPASFAIRVHNKCELSSFEIVIFMSNSTESASLGYSQSADGQICLLLRRIRGSSTPEDRIHLPFESIPARETHHRIECTHLFWTELSVLRTHEPGWFSAPVIQWNPAIEGSAEATRHGETPGLRPEARHADIP